MTRAAAILAFALGIALGIVAGLSLVYRQPPPQTEWREPYDYSVTGI